MNKKVTPYLLIIPQLIITGIIVASIIIIITESLGIVRIYGLNNVTFKYYKEILMDENIHNGLIYSLKIAFISSTVATVVGVGLSAIFLNLQKSKFFVKLVQIPIIIPHIAITIFLINILSKNGLIARVFYWLGFISDQQEFPTLIYDEFGIGLLIGYIWKEIPFVIFIVISLMANINGKLGEAAYNLGASKMRIFKKILLPLSQNTIISGFLIIFVFSFGAYELPALLGATSPKSLPVLTYESFLHPNLKHRPYSMALSGIIISISLLCSLVYYFVISKQVKELNSRL